MKPTPNPLSQYHVFLASPGDVGAERQYVRRFFDEYNRHTAHIWRARFEVVDWENYATIGIGRPQDVANAVGFLLADTARWITGTVLVVDGGYLAQ